MQQPEDLEFVTLDVFTQTPFLGNPLAIVQVPKTLTLQQHLKQKIACEFNLSETVFLYEGEDSTLERRIEIYTPT